MLKREEEEEDEDEEEEEEDEEEEEEEEKTMSDLDRMTLQLMMPKHAYNRYLSQNEPAQYEEKQRFAQKVRRHRHDIELALEQGLHQLQNVHGETDSFLQQGANPDILACTEQLCKLVIRDLEVKQSAHTEDMFAEKSDVTRYSLDNFNWHLHGVRVHKTR